MDFPRLTACKKVSDCLFGLVQQEAVKSKVAEQRKKFSAEDDTRKLVVNDELVGMRPQIRSLHPRMAQELKRAVDDGRVCDAVAQAEVPDLWMKHVQLSINLEMLRNNWRGVKKKVARQLSGISTSLSLLTGMPTSRAPSTTMFQFPRSLFSIFFTLPFISTEDARYLPWTDKLSRIIYTQTETRRSRQG